MLHPTGMVIKVNDFTFTMAYITIAEAHIETDILFWVLSMPEEINRMVTVCLGDYKSNTTELAGQNLSNAGVKEKQIFFVGNVMINILLTNMERLVKPALINTLSLKENEYIILTCTALPM